MRKLLLAALASVVLGGVALAQYYPGANVLITTVGKFALPIINAGPQSAVLPMSGGTFTCASSTATVADTNFNAGSNVSISLKTVGGTVAEPFIATTTPGTGFTVTCGGSDTSTYSYLIFG